MNFMRNFSKEISSTSDENYRCVRGYFSEKRKMESELTKWAEAMPLDAILSD